MLSFLTIVLAAIVATDASLTKRAEYRPYAGQKTPGSYIVTLKPGSSKPSHLSWFRNHFGNTSSLVYPSWSESVHHGFAAQLSGSDLDALRDNPDVEAVEEDGIMTINEVQNDAPWGISRLSQSAKLSGQSTSALDYTYTYNPKAGKGVDVYVLDTGIHVDHIQFGGRARLGAVFGKYENKDGHGHGTHCAGTIGSERYGVAKQVGLVAVKVLDDQGSGSVSNIVSGIDFVVKDVASTGKPAVISLSLGGTPSTSLDNAIRSAIKAGVHCVIAAGNNNANANGYSPARVEEAITVGATTISDAKASYSNYGPVVDIFAPGSNITSTWMGASNNATNTISGTSMAAPHVAGLVAYLISVDGNGLIAKVLDRLHGLGVKDALTGLPSGTVNELARNDQ